MYKLNIENHNATTTYTYGPHTLRVTLKKDGTIRWNATSDMFSTDVILNGDDGYADEGIRFKTVASADVDLDLLTTQIVTARTAAAIFQQYI